MGAPGVGGYSASTLRRQQVPDAERLWSPVSGLWSLVSGLWSLVSGLWSLVKNQKPKTKGVKTKDPRLKTKDQRRKTKDRRLKTFADAINGSYIICRIIVLAYPCPVGHTEFVLLPFVRRVVVIREVIFPPCG